MLPYLSLFTSYNRFYDKIQPITQLLGDFPSSELSTFLAFLIYYLVMDILQKAFFHENKTPGFYYKIHITVYSLLYAYAKN